MALSDGEYAEWVASRSVTKKIAADLVGAIRARRLRHWDALPASEGLAREWGASARTVTRAKGLLAARGLAMKVGDAFYVGDIDDNGETAKVNEGEAGGNGMINGVRPSPTRMYDYYLGGKDHFAVDRVAADRALSAVPDGRIAARHNRDFLIRAVRYMTGRGIDQFIDLGTGIPTSPSVHEVARAVNPGSVVAYVDNDQTAVVHGRALLAGSGDGIIAVEGDIRDPLGILTDRPVQELIDFSRPVGVLFVAVLHFITDEEDPYRAVAEFRERMSAGSYMAISHITSDGMEPGAIKAIREAYQGATAPAVFRTGSQVRDFFTGLSLADPGLTEPCQWRPEPREKNGDGVASLRFWCGVGRKA